MRREDIFHIFSAQCQKLLLTTWILPVVQYLLANEAVVIACSCASYLFQADKPGTRAGLQSHQLKVLFIGLYLPAFYVNMVLFWRLDYTQASKPTILYDS